MQSYLSSNHPSICSAAQNAQIACKISTRSLICTANALIQNTNRQIPIPKHHPLNSTKCTQFTKKHRGYLNADISLPSTGVGSVVTTLILGSLSSGGSCGSCGARVLTGLV